MIAFNILGFSAAIIRDLAFLPFFLLAKVMRRFHIDFNPKPEKAKVGKTAVVLFHGAGFCQAQWIIARLFLIGSEIGSVYSLNYDEDLPFNPLGNGIKDCAGGSKLRKLMVKIKEETQQNRVIVIGCSMGSLVGECFAQHYAEEMGIEIPHVLSLFSPWQGTPIIDWLGLKGRFFQEMSQVSGSPEHLAFRKNLLEEATRAERSGKRLQWNIWSKHDYLVPGRTGCLTEEPSRQREFSGMGHSASMISTRVLRQMRSWVMQMNKPQTSPQRDDNFSIPWRKLSLRQLLEGGVIFGFYGLLRLLPTDLCSALGGFLGRTLGPRLRQMNKSLLKNISLLRPEASKEEQEQLACRYWDHMGRTIAEVAALHELRKSERIEIQGKEHYEKAKETGRPLLFLAIHTGNYELVGPQLMEVLGHRGFNVYGEHNHLFLNKIFKRIRSPYKEYLVSERERFAFKKIYQGLLQGWGLITALDDTTRSYPSFGRNLPSRNNLERAIRIAKRTNAILIPTYCLRKKGAHFAIHILPHIEPDFTDFNEEKMAEAIKPIDQLMGSIVRQHIDQWYWACRDLGLHTECSVKPLPGLIVTRPSRSGNAP